MPVRVQIVAARGLPGGWSRPSSYCTCQVPMKQHTRVSTPVASGSSEPQWGFEQEVPGVLAGDPLIFTLYKKDSRDAVIGEARVEHTTIMSGFDGELPLSGGDRGSTPYLRVRIVSGPAAASSIGSRPVVSGTRSAPSMPTAGGAGPSSGKEPLKCEDPRSTLGRLVGVVAFQHQNKPEPWDDLCGAGFLSNHFPQGSSFLQIASPLEPGRRQKFANAEAAFQALHFWPLANEFSTLSGIEAEQKRRQFRGREDPNFAGFLNEWRAMQNVLGEKFKAKSQFAMALVKTGDAYLLYHDSNGTENTWSNGGNGQGRNWLGLQLMLLRDKLSGQAPSWTGYIESLFDLASGRPLNNGQFEKWQESVRRATKAVTDKFGTSRGGGPQGSYLGGNIGPSMGTLRPRPLTPPATFGSLTSLPPGPQQHWAMALTALARRENSDFSQPGSGPCNSWNNALSLMNQRWPSAPGGQFNSMPGFPGGSRSPGGFPGGQGGPGQYPPMSFADRPTLGSTWGPGGVGPGRFASSPGGFGSPGGYGPPGSGYGPQAGFGGPPGSYGPQGGYGGGPGGWGGGGPGWVSPINQPWGGGGTVSPYGGSQTWSGALSLMNNPWPGQQQSVMPYRSGAVTPPSSVGLSPDMLALVPEAMSNSQLSDTASVVSAASSEFSTLNAARSLYKACQDGDFREAERVLKEGYVNPDCRNPKGATPLFAAAFGNHQQVVKLLLECEADADRTNNDSATPAFIAAQRDSSAALKLLLNAKADPDRSRKDRATPTFIASANSSVGSLEMLLREKADPNLANKNGDTPLTIAAYSGHLQAVRLLLRAKANVNAPGYKGQESALDCAVRAEESANNAEARSKAEAVKQLLLQCGAQPLNR